MCVKREPLILVDGESTFAVLSEHKAVVPHATEGCLCFHPMKELSLINFDVAHLRCAMLWLQLVQRTPCVLGRYVARCGRRSAWYDHPNNVV